MDSGIEGLRCTVPLLPDTGAPDRIVGDGTAASCTEAAVRAALPGGGVIAFNCGGPVTIAVTSELVIADPSTTIDGTGVTLDGGGLTRILRATATVAELTLVGLTIRNGATNASGAGLLVQGGTLAVFDAVFADNLGPLLSPFDGGGAITTDPGVVVTIVRSRFERNQAANGGALHTYSDLTVIDSVFTGNAATGTGGNTDQGGLGGGIRAVGMANNRFCNVVLDGNRANHAGGGYLRISTTGSGTDRWDRALLQNNLGGGGGGMYVQDVALQLDRVAVIGNTGSVGGGIWHLGGAFDATNLLIVDNEANRGLGGGLSIAGTGTIAFSTIANNRASCPTCWAGGIDATAVTLTASVVAHNRSESAGQPVSCRTPLADGGSNFQIPGGDLCTTAITIADPLFGELAIASGPAGAFPVLRPLAGSPVIGAASDCPTTDLLGYPRPTPCAAGALER